MVEINQVLEEIVSDIYEKFGRSVTDACRLNRGWLNVKWRFATEHGPVFVKFYHPDRYKLHVSEKRKKIELTLSLQQRLHESGLACPEVYASSEGMFVQETPAGHHYVTMNWVEGNVPIPGSMGHSHVVDLGKTTGHMHQLLQQVPLAKQAWKPDRAACLKELRANLEQAIQSNNLRLTALLEKVIRNIQTLDFKRFSECPVGWLHWDLWADNLLLDAKGIAAIVDFDRMDVAYPEIDIARAVLSSAWEMGWMRVDAVQAFLDGYREHAEAPRGKLLQAVQLLYLIESVWWLRTEIYEETGVPVRFLQEMEWLTEQWDRLPDLIGHL